MWPKLAASVSNITYTTANIQATSTLDATGYWMVVAMECCCSDAGTVKSRRQLWLCLLLSPRVRCQDAKVEKSFDITGLSAGTAYDLYFFIQRPLAAIL
jgi:hypothetical protein